MSIFDTHGEKARKALADSVSLHALAVANLDAHRLAPADPSNAVAQKEWQRIDADLAEDVGIAANVVEHWRGVVARLDEEAAKKAKAEEKAATEKEARAFDGLVRKIGAKAVGLKADIDRLEAHRARAAAAGVDDAELRVRRKPGRIQPAITETTSAWFDPEGRRYGTNLTHDDSGRVVKAEDRIQREVVDVIRPETESPGEMPERFVDAIQLVGLDGRSL